MWSLIVCWLKVSPRSWQQFQPFADAMSSKRKGDELQGAIKPSQRFRAKDSAYCMPQRKYEHYAHVQRSLQTALRKEQEARRIAEAEAVLESCGREELVAKTQLVEKAFEDEAQENLRLKRKIQQSCAAQNKQRQDSREAQRKIQDDYALEKHKSERVRRELLAAREAAYEAEHRMKLIALEALRSKANSERDRKFTEERCRVKEDEAASSRAIAIAVHKDNCRLASQLQQSQDALHSTLQSSCQQLALQQQAQTERETMFRLQKHFFF
jgi:hypothetical protein